MQKYKIVASKSQKKYTIVLSADSESEAKEKLHKENYSILSISEVDDKAIDGHKFIFQVELDGNIKNGVIVGKDIFKVYKKLRNDLGYNVIFLYPEGDEAHENAEKKAKIMEELKKWYELQEKKVKIKEEKKAGEQRFYMKKQLDSTYALIDLVVEKFDKLFNDRKQYNIDDETFAKIQDVYEKLVHIKWSTNLVKLREIWELALTKIAQIELERVETNKNTKSRELLKETNILLKKIGSNRQFIEKDKDFKRMIWEIFQQIFWAISFSEIKKVLKEKDKKKQLLDKESYNFLKTVLLLEKYKEKLKSNSSEMRKNFLLFVNPFSKSEKKEKILLKRKVIKQNISILKAKKTGSISSYTGVKKWYYKAIDVFIELLSFLGKISFFLIVFYIILFFWNLLSSTLGFWVFIFNTQALQVFLLFFLLYVLFSLSKNLFLFSLNVVFFSFIFIFSVVNF